MIQCEDEWAEIRSRFKQEGLEFSSLKPEEHVVLIWRWLGDCEINLKNSRKMFDKFRDQQHEELEEIENYFTCIKNAAETKANEYEHESEQLREQLQSISSIIIPFSLEGNTVIEKVSNFIEEYTKLKNELQIVEKLKPYSLKNDDLISDLIKVSSEKETLKRELEEINDRMQVFQKNSRELEQENEKLILKLTEVFTELDEKEVQLGELTMRYSISRNDSALIRSESTAKFNSRCSEVGTYENEFNNSVTFFKKDVSFGADSTPPSLMTSELASFGSPKLSSLMDSCHELARLEENKKLQSECESLKNQLANLGEKYNNLALKYIQLKSKRRFQIEEIRGRLDASQCHIQTLQSQLSVQRQRLRAEEMFRKQVECDLRKVQEEKRDVCKRLLNAEMEQKESVREANILQKKICMLDTANSDLLAKLLRMKYTETTLPKITTHDKTSPV